MANHLFQASPPDRSFRWEDITFATLEDALLCARTLNGSSRAVPLPERTQPVSPVWSPRSMSRSNVRSQVGWLPQPPRWWDITRKVLIVAWWLLILVVPLVHLAGRTLMGDEYGMGDLVVALSLWGVLLVGAYPAALLGDGSSGDSSVPEISRDPLAYPSDFYRIHRAAGGATMPGL